MIQPNDVDKAFNEGGQAWEDFKKKAVADELYYKGEGDLLDTAEGRALFCRSNESGVFRKDDPANPGYKIWVFNNHGCGMVVKKRSSADPTLMENMEYDAEGNFLSKSFEPA